MSMESLFGPERPPLLACAPDDLLTTAVERLVREKANAVAVTGASGQLVGILSDQDIIRAVYAGSGSVRRARVEDWMTRNVITVPVATRLAAAVNLMASHRIRHVVVTDEADNPVAVVGLRAVLRKLHELDELEMNVLRDIAVARR